MTAVTFEVTAVLLDIEGTITSISFVKDVLFPYAAAHVTEYLVGNWDIQECRDDVTRLREQAQEDEKNGMVGVPLIMSEGDPNCSKDNIIHSVVSNVHWLMKADRKVGALKQLQGHIWRQGYCTGQIVGQVYADAAQQIMAWHSKGIGVWIYSSGSVEAQKLLLKYSEAGNLLEYVSGHFDTAVGGKREATSYKAIAEQIGVEASDVLFMTDIIEEAKAAQSTNMKVTVAVRPGNAPLTEGDKELFPTITDFSLVQVTLP